jgi:hypothetical protein
VSGALAGVLAMEGAGDEDRGGLSTATTTSLSSAIVAGRNMLRRRCYGPETSRQANILIHNGLVWDYRLHD